MEPTIDALGKLRYYAALFQEELTRRASVLARNAGRNEVDEASLGAAASPMKVYGFPSLTLNVEKLPLTPEAVPKMGELVRKFETELLRRVTVQAEKDHKSIFTADDVVRQGKPMRDNGWSE